MEATPTDSQLLRHPDACSSPLISFVVVFKSGVGLNVFYCSLGACGQVSVPSKLLVHGCHRDCAAFYVFDWIIYGRGSLKQGCWVIFYSAANV